MMPSRLRRDRLVNALGRNRFCADLECQAQKNTLAGEPGCFWSYRIPGGKGSATWGKALMRYQMYSLGPTSVPCDESKKSAPPPKIERAFMGLINRAVLQFSGRGRNQLLTPDNIARAANTPPKAKAISLQVDDGPSARRSISSSPLRAIGFTPGLAS
jgi:hypothetical protein